MQALDVPLIIGIHTIGEHGLGCLQKPELCHPMCGHSRYCQPATNPSLTRPSVRSTGMQAGVDASQPRWTVNQSAACVKELGLQMRRAAPQGDLWNAAPAYHMVQAQNVLDRAERLADTSGETVAGVEGHNKSTEPLPGLASRPRGVGRLISHSGGTSKREACELCQVRSSSRDLFGSATDSESDSRRTLAAPRICCRA